MSKEFLKLPFEVKNVTENDEFFILEGIMSTPDIDHANDIVTPESVSKSISEFGLPKFLHQHDQDQKPLGTWDEFKLDGNSSIVTGRLPKDVQDSKDAAILARMGAYGGLSIGYIVISAQDINGKEIPKAMLSNFSGIRVITELKILEVSLVSIPCNEFAEVLAVKARDKSTSTTELIEVKNLIDKRIKEEKEMENKGANLSALIKPRIEDMVTTDRTKEDVIAMLSNRLGLSVDGMNDIIEGRRDVVGAELGEDIAWFFNVMESAIGMAILLDAKESGEDKNIEEVKSLKDVEAYLKSKDCTNSESKTIISKVAEFKRLSDSDGLNDNEDLSDLDKEDIESEKKAVNMIKELRESLRQK